MQPGAEATRGGRGIRRHRRGRDRRVDLRHRREAGDRPPTKNFTEQYVLGELYRQALEAKGYDVTLKSDIGATEIIDAALTSGEIDVYPEYTGTALTVVFGAEGSEDTAEATYEAARSQYETGARRCMG